MSEPRKYIYDEEETELDTFLKSCAGIGYGKTTKEVKSIKEHLKAVLKHLAFTLRGSKYHIGITTVQY